ncbi:MAG: hypothetical protein GX434_05125 [Peptococcaceae bacterium]|nr:hypothetical protein [Peptococcaceae bacterium]
MIKYILLLFVFASSYYTFTFGKSLWTDDQNKIGGFGAVLISFLSAAATVVFMLTGNE